jgi:DNA processing protein
VAGDPARLVAATRVSGPPAVALVGARRGSAEGLEMARALGRGLAAAGVVVVSGMAMGIDAAAHRGALEAGGPTIAVLACGPEIPYPRHEERLHRELLRTQSVISELPPGTTPRRWCFPARNRIIAALAQLTVVVEAAARSGSLITAEFAIALGRDVGVVPGRAGSPATRGGNSLLREGAAVVLEPEDVLDLVLGTDRPVAERPDPADGLPEGLARVLTDVRRGHGSVAALVREGHGAQEAMMALGELELLGLVRRVAGGMVVAAGC